MTKVLEDLGLTGTKVLSVFQSVLEAISSMKWAGDGGARAGIRDEAGAYPLLSDPSIALAEVESDGGGVTGAKAMRIRPELVCSF